MNLLNNLLAKGKTQFHVVSAATDFLLENGFTPVTPTDGTLFVPGGKYIISPYSSMMVAFVIGCNANTFRLASCHTDFPMLKLKPHPEISKKKYMQVNVEPYGGLICSTWFDKPLGLAGKVVTAGQNIFEPKVHLFDSKRPVFIIPNLAPHLKKDDKADGIDVAKELIPIAGLQGNYDTPVSEFIMDYIAKELDVSMDSILDYDLYLYIDGEAITVGLNNDFLCSPRIDNVSSVAAILKGLTSPHIDNCIAIGAFFDNEEIGSRSKQGADSVLLRDIINYIIPDKSFYHNAFNISLDVAHGTHPNYTEKSDITNDIILGDGIVLKTSASQRYVTDSEAGAVVTGLCQIENIRLQKQVNRSGMAGGQTLGPIMSAYLPIKSVDMGIPVLAMHSSMELAARSDYEELVKFIKKYYEY